MADQDQSSLNEDMISDEILLKIENLVGEYDSRLLMLDRERLIDAICAALFVAIPDLWAASTEVKNRFVANIAAAVSRRLIAAQRPTWAN